MAFVEVPVRRMVFHGPLIARFGREFLFRAHNAPKMISAAKNLLDGFEQYLLEAHKRGFTFAVFVGNERKRNVSEEELEMTNGTDDIHLVPIIIGSKRGGLFQTILGIGLLSSAVFFPWGTAFAASNFLGAVGASMAIGGVVQLISPQTTGLRMRQDTDNKPSYAFGGPVNTTAQGNPIPVGYGRREVGA